MSPRGSYLSYHSYLNAIKLDNLRDLVKVTFKVTFITLKIKLPTKLPNATYRKYWRNMTLGKLGNLGNFPWRG